MKKRNSKKEIIILITIEEIIGISEIITITIIEIIEMVIGIITTEITIIMVIITLETITILKALDQWMKEQSKRILKI